MEALKEAKVRAEAKLASLEQRRVFCENHSRQLTLLQRANPQWSKEEDYKCDLEIEDHDFEAEEIEAKQDGIRRELQTIQRNIDRLQARLDAAPEP